MSAAERTAERAAWYARPRAVAAAAAVLVAVLALAALASTIDGDESAGDGPRDISGNRTGGSDVREFDLGDGRVLEVRPLPDCEGGYELGDRIIVVPDPEACGFRALEPGEFGYGVGGGRTLLVPSPEGDIGGFRLGPDGIELIAPGALRGGDFLFSLIPGGPIELFGPDGFPLPQSVPEPGASDGGSTDDGSTDGDRTILLVLAVAAGMALVGSALWYWLTRRIPAADPDPLEGSDLSVEISAIDRLLWEIDQESDPRAAIRRTYAALETGLGDQALARRAHETPGVYLQRTLGRFDALDRPLRDLVTLFERARFSDHTITSEMRDEAVGALHEIRARLVDRVLDTEFEVGSRPPVGAGIGVNG